jgi:uncharacterized membrane protein YphA (DoxX/SURF4 family)
MWSEESVMMNGINDELTLAARLLLATLFLIFGYRKLRDFSGTVSQMVQLGVPMPTIAAAVATFMELPVAFAVAVGAFTRAVADGISPRIAPLTMKFSNLWLWDASPAPPTATAYLVDPVG